jgi:hypothetical protein
MEMKVIKNSIKLSKKEMEISIPETNDCSTTTIVTPEINHCWG